VALALWPRFFLLQGNVRDGATTAGLNLYELISFYTMENQVK